MKIAILGGGIAGLTAAYYLAKSDQSVTLYEKEEALGGLAAGFRVDGWEWPLERAYHHLFSNDYDILSFAKEIQYDDIFFSSPITSSLAYKNDEFSLFPFDTPVDFFSYPHLTVQDKLRTAAVIAFLKASPFLKMYEHISSEEFLKKYMGGNVWDELWSELFRKKFGKYAENIAAAFIWARIKKRTKKLGYMRGGFQSFINHAGVAAEKSGAQIRMGKAAGTIEAENGQFMVNGELFDTVLSTLPTPLLAHLGKKVFPHSYVKGFAKLKYLHATNLIIASKKPLIRESYWANVLAPELPIMVLVAHTNMISSKHYGGDHVLYVGNYVDKDSNLLAFDAKKALNHFLPFLRKINPDFTPNPDRTFYFKGPFAQPIYDEDFLKYKPEIISPTKNFYIANLDMAYPYDRGTNYAVALGKQASSTILSKGA